MIVVSFTLISLLKPFSKSELMSVGQNVETDIQIKNFVGYGLFLLTFLLTLSHSTQLSREFFFDDSFCIAQISVQSDYLESENAPPTFPPVSN